MSTAVLFFNPIPSGLNTRRQRTQWVEVMGPTTLPAGKAWIQRTGAYTSEECISRGVTHFSSYDLVHMESAEVTALMTAGKTYDSVPRPEAFFGLTYDPSKPDDAVDGYGIHYNPRWYPNGPFNQAQAEAKGYAMGLGHAIFIGETEEGTSWIAPNHPMWRWFWNIFCQRMAAKWTALGIQWFVATNYFHFELFDWSELGKKTRSVHKAKFARPISEWEGNDYTPGGTKAASNLICEGIYLSAPDGVRKRVLQHIFRCLINRKLGYFTCTFLFGQHEWHPNSFGSVHYDEEWYPTDGEFGTLYRSDKITLDPNDIMSFIVWGKEFGDIYHEWNASGKITTDDLGYAWNAQDLWFPGDGDTPTAQAPEPDGGSSTIAVDFPHYSVPGGSSKGWRYNWSAFGVRMYSETFGKVVGSGSTAGFCEYRMNGSGSWLTPQVNEADEVTDAFFDERAIVRYRRKGGQIAIGYFNQSAPNTKQTIEIRHPSIPGVVYTATVCGSATHVVLINE
jgi:hypothetical protein